MTDQGGPETPATEALREALTRPAPNEPGCECRRDEPSEGGSGPVVLCPKHERMLRPLRWDTLASMAVDFMAALHEYRTLIRAVPAGDAALHPEERCERCGGPNIVWHTPSPLWNAVMRWPDGTDAYGIVCPRCFVRLAEHQKVVTSGVWHLAPEPMPDLPQTNADGRTWDATQCLWVDALPASTTGDDAARLDVERLREALTEAVNSQALPANIHHRCEDALGWELQVDERESGIQW